MKPISCAVLSALLLLTMPVLAAPTVVPSPIAIARAELDAGDMGSALQTLDSYLTNNPANADARFLRGLVLSRLNRRSEAIEVFRALTHDFPKLPEPYNNLAVLYAQQGDLDLARDTLESCVTQQPEYAPAHENLGDVYAALAAKAYGHALAIAPNDAGARYKLSLVSQIGAGAPPAAH
jgi:Flp pilus assembly protein TadD